MNIFERAARGKFRFRFTSGELTVEQLFDLSLPRLDTIARGVNSELKSVTEESFISTTPHPSQSELECKLEIVKHVIASKLADQKAAEIRAANAEKRRRLLDALSAKEDAELTGLSKEDLIKQIEALG